MNTIRIVRKTVLVVMLLGLAACGGGGGGGSTSSTVPRFAYVANGDSRDVSACTIGPASITMATTIE